MGSRLLLKTNTFEMILTNNADYPHFFIDTLSA